MSNIPSSFKTDAAAYIAQGADEWMHAAVKVGIADNMEEASELYEDEPEGIHSTLADAVASFWFRNGGYVRRYHASQGIVKGFYTYHFADEAEESED